MLADYIFNLGAPSFVHFWETTMALYVTHMVRHPPCTFILAELYPRLGIVTSQDDGDISQTLERINDSDCPEQ